MCVAAVGPLSAPLLPPTYTRTRAHTALHAVLYVVCTPPSRCVHIFLLNGSRLSRFIAIRPTNARISVAEGRFTDAILLKDSDLGNSSDFFCIPGSSNHSGVIVIH